MKRYLSSAICAATLLLSSVSIDAIATAAFAQSDDEINFRTFHEALAPYGDWVYSDRWGEVWIPEDVPPDFRPYATDGYWVYTNDYGWMWASNYEWGDIPFHFGRWVNDPEDGWLWIPGYVWSPAWVVWRSNGRYVGWMPMPPDRQFLGWGGPSFGFSFGRGFGFSVNFGNTNGYYGYSDWYGPDYSANDFASNWVFVDEGHMADRDFRRYQAPRNNYVSLIRKGRNITNYSVTNNYIVNRSVDPRAVQRAGGHPVPVVNAAQVYKKPQWIVPANQGQQIQMRMRQENPHGTGTPDSAPKPSAQVVQSLSTKVAPRNGHPTAHLFTRDTVTNAPLPAKPGGNVPNQGPLHGNPATLPGGGTNPTFQRGGPNTPPPSSPTTGPTAPGQPNEFMRHGPPTNSTASPPATPQGGPQSQPSAPNNPTATPNQPSFSDRHRMNENVNPSGPNPNGANPNGPPPSGTPPTQRQFVTPPQNPNGPASPGGANNPSNGPAPNSERFRQMQQPNPGGPPASQNGPNNPGNASGPNPDRFKQMQQPNPGSAPGGGAVTQPQHNMPNQNMPPRPPGNAQTPNGQQPPPPKQGNPNQPQDNDKNKHDDNGKPPPQ